MKSSVVYSLISGICLMAIGASSKAIIDVAVLKAENKTTKELLKEVRDDVKHIRNHLIQE